MRPKKSSNFEEAANAATSSESSADDLQQVASRESEPSIEETDLEIGSTQPTIDDGISSESEDPTAMTELAQLQDILEKVSSGNQRSIGMLAQASDSFMAVQSHLAERHKSSTDGIQRRELAQRQVELEEVSAENQKLSEMLAQANDCVMAVQMQLGTLIQRRQNSRTDGIQERERCADEDSTVLTTSYKGTYNHPIPPGTMAIMSTISAAKNMHFSGPVPSKDSIKNPRLLQCSSNNTVAISASSKTPKVSFPRNNKSKFSGLQMSTKKAAHHMMGTFLQLPKQQQQQQQHHTCSSSANALSAATAATVADTDSITGSSSVITTDSHPKKNS